MVLELTIINFLIILWTHYIQLIKTQTIQTNVSIYYRLASASGRTQINWYDDHVYFIRYNYKS